MTRSYDEHEVIDTEPTNRSGYQLAGIAEPVGQFTSVAWAEAVAAALNVTPPAPTPAPTPAPSEEPF